MEVQEQKDSKQDIWQKVDKKDNGNENTETLDQDSLRVSISLNVSQYFASTLKNHAKKTNLPLSKLVHFLLQSYFLHYEDEKLFLERLKILKELFTEKISAKKSTVYWWFSTWNCNYNLDLFPNQLRKLYCEKQEEHFLSFCHSKKIQSPPTIIVLQ